MIYTIGYQRLTPERLQIIAGALNATVIDCRFKPISRKPGFGGRQLSTLLGSRYQQHGHHLGGFWHVSPDGIDFIKSFPGNSLLICAEEAPGDCHRHSDICAPYFPEAIHIFRDELFLASALKKAIDDDDEYELIGSLSDLLLQSA